MSVIIFLIILAVLIFIHELGHFLVAKISGIRVDEFALGFPPRLFSFTKGETRYALNLIPFGGYVKIFGENPDENPETVSTEERARNFSFAKKQTQVLVLIAGVFFNALLAWALFSIGFATGLPASVEALGQENVANVKLIILGVEAGSPADQASLKAGSEIVSLASGSTGLTRPTVAELQSFISSRVGKEIVVTYREGINFKQNLPIKTVTIKPVANIVPGKAGLPTGKAGIGISIDQVAILKLPLPQAIWRGGAFTLQSGLLILKTLSNLISQSFQGQGQSVLASFVGPIGLIGVVGDATNLGFIYLLSLTALISINLAVINLIPFPALDGGRVLFVIIEALKGSPIKPKIANMLNVVGFGLLILLMVLITYQDIARLFLKN